MAVTSKCTDESMNRLRLPGFGSLGYLSSENCALHVASSASLWHAGSLAVSSLCGIHVRTTILSRRRMGASRTSLYLLSGKASRENN
jgi:hypothetical protein